MIPVAIIREEAAATVLRHCVPLKGKVTFAADVQYVSTDMIIVDLRVSLIDHMTLLPEVANRGSMSNFEAMLDQFRGHEPRGGYDFTINNTRFLVGDGDDPGAVRMDGYDTARIWVRAWRDQ